MLEQRWLDGKKSEPFDTKPELYSDLVWIWEAFWLLSNARGHGMGGALPIQISELKAYVELYGVEDEDREEFIYLIYMLDREFFDYVNDERKKKDIKAHKESEKNKRKSNKR